MYTLSLYFGQSAGWCSSSDPSIVPVEYEWCRLPTYVWCLCVLMTQMGSTGVISVRRIVSVPATYTAGVVGWRIPAPKRDHYYFVYRS